MLVKKTIEVPKETDEIAVLIEELIIRLVKAKRNDGKIDGAEMITIATSLIGDMSTAIDGAGEIKNELKANPEAFLLSWLNAGAGIYKELAKDDPKEEEKEEEKKEDEETE